MDEQRSTRPVGNLPSPASRFIGRQRELAEVRRPLEASRLLTLTGPGGVGRTRPAVQAAAASRQALGIPGEQVLGSACGTVVVDAEEVRRDRLR